MELFFFTFVVDFLQAYSGMVHMKITAVLIGLVICCLLAACSSEKPLEPTDTNALKDLLVSTPSGTRAIFSKYDYYMATNVSGGGTLENLAMNSAALTFTRSHRVTVTAWYPDASTVVASNTFPISASVTLLFSGSPVYHFTNTLRIRAWDEDEAREVLNAKW